MSCSRNRQSEPYNHKPMAIPYIIITQQAPPASGRAGTQISYARSVSSGRIGTDKLSEKISKISTVSRGDVAAVLYSLGEVVPFELGRGHIVDLEGIGTYRIIAGSGAFESPGQVTPLEFRPPRIIYRPCKAFREMLKNLRFTLKS